MDKKTLSSRLGYKLIAALMLAAMMLSGLPVNVALAAQCNSTGNGTWGVAGTWDCGHVPLAADNVWIQSGHTVTISANTATMTATVKIDGTAAGTARLVMGAGSTLDGAGSITVTDRVDTVSGTVTIASTANLNIASRIDVKTAVTVTNNGIVTVANITGNNATTSIWVNAANSTLNYTGAAAPINTGVLTATAPPNTVNYSLAGAQTAKVTTYNNLTFSGSGAKTASGVVTANGNLTINNGVTLSTANSVNIGGNWNVDGTYSQTAGTTTFTGGGTHTLSGTGSSQFNNLTTSSQTINAGASDIRINGNWTHGTTGSFNEQTSTVTFNGAAGQTQPTTSFVPQFYNLTINKSGGTLSPRVWTVTNNFVLTLGTFAPNANSSFKNVTLDGGTFTAPAGNINVSGNWTSNGNIFTAGTGTVTFNGSAAQTIGGSSATTFNNLTINNSTGVSLSGINATVNGTLTFTSGKIATGANTLIIGSSGTVTNSGTDRYVYGYLQKIFNTTGTGQTFKFDIGDDANYTPAELTNFNVTAAGNITASTTAARHPEFMSVNIGDKYVKRYWTLTPGGALTTGGYTATFTFVSNDLVGTPDTATLIVKKYSGSSWSAGEPTSSSSTSTTVTGNGFTSFSDFFSGNGGTPTPVTLSYFNAQRNGDSLQFDWSTATETGNVGFNLYVDDGNERTLINDELIPSMVTDSLDRQDYTFSANVKGNIFYIEDVSVLGEARQHGPFQLGEEYGNRLEADKVDWLTIQQGLNTGQTARQDALTSELSLLVGDSAGPQGSAVTALNFKVRQTGIHHVTYEILKDAGLDLAGVPLNKITLTNRGKAVPLYLKGKQNFGPGAFIEFYGQALDTIYTDTNIYTLQLSRVSARQIPVENGLPGKILKPHASYAETLVINSQRAYANYAPGNDAWYDTSMLVYQTSKSWNFPFQIKGLANPNSTASLELVVWGVTNFPQSPDHHLIVSVNGVAVADQLMEGLVEQTLKIELPAGVLMEGGNTLQLTLPGDTGVKWDMVNLDKFSLRYQRMFQAQDGRLTFTAAGKVFKVTNLPGKDVVVYRMDKKGLVRLQQIRVQATGSTFTATFAGTGTSSTYMVAAAKYLYTPAFEAARLRANLNRPAQYLIISHPDFINGIQPLMQARQAQGLTVSVVDVTDLYTQYTSGIFDPQAIKKYIAFAAKNLGTQYVLLVGGDTYDYRNYLGRNSISFIPSLYITTGSVAKFVPADPLYADINQDNVPDLAIGRFPVRTMAELDLMVNKTLTYSGKDYGRTAVFASDKNDGMVSFKDISASLSSGLPADWSVENIHLDDLSVASARDQLLASMNRGTALVTFTGHSGPASWTFSNLFNTNNAAALTNSGRPFVVVQWGCWNTYYVDPVNNYLVQKFLFSGDQGAAAVLGASTLTDSESEQRLGGLMMPRLVRPGMSLGQALQEAKSELAQTHPELLDVLLGWSLMGDPALVIEH